MLRCKKYEAITVETVLKAPKEKAKFYEITFFRTTHGLVAHGPTPTDQGFLLLWG